MPSGDRITTEREIDLIVAELRESERRFSEAPPAEQHAAERAMVEVEERLERALTRANTLLAKADGLVARSRRTYFLAIIAIARAGAARERSHARQPRPR